MICKVYCSSNRRSLWFAACYFVQVLMLAGLAGCSPSDTFAQPQQQTTVSSKSNEPVMLAITGYNYTSRHIAFFSVNGQGGGNLYVSSRTSGGGSTVCCVRYKPGAKVRKLNVEWQSGGCYYSEKSTISDEVSDTLHYFRVRRDVEVDPHIPADPQVMEVHFYPDGSIHAAITSQESPPRFKLDESRADKSLYPRCPNDQKPAE